MKHTLTKKMSGRAKRARRVRKKVFGSAERPRLSVYRSNKNIYVQLVNDKDSVSLLGMSSAASEITDQKIEGGKIGISKALGKAIAEKAKEKGITEVVFDRGGFLYHGRVKAVAEGAREGGLVL